MTLPRLRPLGAASVARRYMVQRARVFGASPTPSATSDDYGQPLPGADDGHIGTLKYEGLPCVVMIDRRPRYVRDGETVMVVGDVRMLCPADADIVEGDRVEEITDRDGRVIQSGPMFVVSVASNRDHNALVLRRVGS